MVEVAGRRPRAEPAAHSGSTQRTAHSAHQEAAGAGNRGQRRQQWLLWRCAGHQEFSVRALYVDSARSALLRADSRRSPITGGARAEVERSAAMAMSAAAPATERPKLLSQGRLYRPMPPMPCPPAPRDPPAFQGSLRRITRFTSKGNPISVAPIAGPPTPPPRPVSKREARSAIRAVKQSIGAQAWRQLARSERESAARAQVWTERAIDALPPRPATATGRGPRDVCPPPNPACALELDESALLWRIQTRSERRHALDKQCGKVQQQAFLSTGAHDYRLDMQALRRLRPIGTPGRNNKRPGMFSQYAAAAIMQHIKVFPPLHPGHAPL